MNTRREFLFRSAQTALAAAAYSTARAAVSNPGIPGLFRGRVIEVSHPGSILAGNYQPQTIQDMMRRGMTELTGAPAWQDAWRTFFERGDVVGIKVSPVGGPTLSSDESVVRGIIAGLNAAGVPNREIVVFSRYRKEIVDAHIDKWLPKDVRWTAPAEDYDGIQLRDGRLRRGSVPGYGAGAAGTESLRRP